MTSSKVIILTAVILISIYVSFPPPHLSTRLKAWKKMGNYFMWKGSNIFYTDFQGNGTDTLICLHGFPTSSYDWMKVLPQLKNDFRRIVLIDFLGYGFSDKPTDIIYTISEQADIVEKLANERQIPSAHILAHDYGDTVALEMLHRLNNGQLGFEMLSLTMLNGGIFPGVYYPRILQKLLLIPVVGPVVSYLSNFVIFQKGFGEVFGTNKPSQSEFEDFWAALRYNNGDRVTYKLLNYIREREQFKTRWVGALKSTKLKVLMVYGPADPVNPPEFALHFQKIVPFHRLVRLDASTGHYPQWEDPDAVTQALYEFTNNLTNKSTPTPDQM